VFIESKETVLDLSPSLTAAQRARAHQMATQLGLEHESVGQGEGRYLRIAKSSAHLRDPSSLPSPSPPQTASAGQMECDDEEDEEQELGEPFGIMRLAVPDSSARGARGGGSGVELVLLPYNFNKLLELIEQLHQQHQCSTNSVLSPKTQPNNAKISQVRSTLDHPLSFSASALFCAAFAPLSTHAQCICTRVYSTNIEIRSSAKNRMSATPREELDEHHPSKRGWAPSQRGCGSAGIRAFRGVRG